MRVVGAHRNFEYAPAAGGSGAFLARLFHASVEPEGASEHLKVAFFFKASTKGERRAQRALAAAGGGGDREELARRRQRVAHEMSVAGQVALLK